MSRLDDVIKTARDLLSRVDEESLLQYLGVKCDASEEAAKTKT